MNLIETIFLCLIAAISASRADNSYGLMLLAHEDEIKNIDLSTKFRSSDSVENQVYFYLFTRENINERQEIFPNELETLKLSNFNPELPTKIVIHGFLDNSDKPMSQSIKKNLLNNVNANVILVDWGDISIGIDYIGIAKKTIDVGAYTALLIDFLVQQGSNLQDIHLIGHSLGAHVAGFAGAGIKSGKLGRITGLDPAKPGFHKVQPGERLDPSDAQFVDCIHTCSGMLGLAEPICTADFYPNGGVNIQPGCHFYDFGRCSHLRAHTYYTESINPEYKYPTFKCNIVPDDAVNPSDCTPSQVTMGFYTTNDVRGIYFGTTSSEQPYAPVHP